jgi:hypothetical protein
MFKGVQRKQENLAVEKNWKTSSMSCPEEFNGGRPPEAGKPVRGCRKNL